MIFIYDADFEAKYKKHVDFVICRGAPHCAMCKKALEYFKDYSDEIFFNGR